MRATSTRRGGFTLVELLVAVTIILVLAGLALLVANSGVIGNNRASSGSDRLTGWLMQARAKAQRDGAPRGIRFLVGPNNFCREAQLIEVPEPYTMPAGNWVMIQQSPAGKRAFVVGPNAADVLANVAAGDTLSVPSAGTIHRVAAPGPTAVPGGVITIGTVNYPAVEVPVVVPALLPDLGAAALAADPPTPTPTFSTPTFGFLRQARPTFGEPPLLVPDSVAIDLANSLIPTDLNGNYDVVFGPSGEVQNAGGIGRVILWTRNPEALAGSPRAGGDLRSVYEQAGEMRHVVVYTRTGAVAVQPVALPVDENAVTPHDPFANTKDGIASGL